MIDFSPATIDEWMARAQAVLKGASFDKLTSITREGICIKPLYSQTEGPRAERGRLAPWTVFQRIDHPDVEKANTQTLDDLTNGATGLILALAGAASARGFGLSDASPTTITKALANIEVHAISLRLDAGTVGRQAAQSLADFIKKRPLNPGLLDLAFGMDPIGVLAQRGHLDEPWSERSKLVARTVAELSADFAGPFLEADGRIWHEKGATVAQELGAVLATSVTYLRALDRLEDGTLSRAVGMTLAADQDMFLALAKFRAARLLWAHVLDACQLPDAALKLHAETSWRMMATLDPHTNILRAVAACFGAGLGGADSITVLPLSLVQGLPNSFARRIARNTQLMLQEESHLWRIKDPALGSGYVEYLTKELCERAWAFFQDIEQRGGIVEALQKGWLAEQMKNASGEASLPKIGTTLYPLKEEHIPEIERSLHA